MQVGAYLATPAPWVEPQNKGLQKQYRALEDSANDTQIYKAHKPKGKIIERHYNVRQKDTDNAELY